MAIPETVPAGPAPVHVPPNFSNEPHRFLAQLREAGTVHHVILPDGVGSWWVTGYDEVDTVLHDHEVFSNEVHHAVEDEDIQNSQALIRKDPVLQLVMINRDPPAHTRMRKLVTESFNARAVDELRPRLEELAEELLDQMAPHERVELIQSYAFPFPVGVICELLGIPRADSDYFGGLVTQMVGAAEPDEALSAIHGLKEFMAEKLAEKRDRPGRDILTHLVQAADENGQLSQNELLAHGLQLLTAGHETSIYLISGGTFRLLQHPGQLDAIKRDPSLLPAAVDELLRYDPPPVPGVFRHVTREVELGGVTIPKDALVIVSLAAANRDHSRFTDPDKLDIMRHSNPHVAFGNGAHYCLGARLARLEGCIAIGGLLRRFPSLRLAIPAEEIEWRPLNFLQRLKALPVLLH